MATTYKTFLNNDIASTRTLLHESIPITGSIVSGTYVGSAGTGENIKTYSHGMFESVYDYPYLSSSANHIFDITVGLNAGAAMLEGSTWASDAQQTKKRNIYDQMAQIAVPYDISGNIQPFDQDGDLTSGGKIQEAFFMNFSRLLVKDEIKKGSFTISFFTGSESTVPASAYTTAHLLTISDYNAATNFKVNSPLGEYGLLYTGSGDVGSSNKVVGHIYYQAGIVALTASIFTFSPAGETAVSAGGQACEFGAPAATYDTSSVYAVLTASTIDAFADGVRNRLNNIQFNNTTELNSTIYFTRANTGDYNYSSNPTYLSSSKIRVKGDNPFAEPASYITTVGLYSADNELLAVAKLSEPLKKTPSNELTLRVRLDY